MVNGTLTYKLPEDKETVARVVELIPPNWSTFSGVLRAPLAFYEKDKVAKDTQLVISRFYSVHPTIVGWKNDLPYEHWTLEKIVHTPKQCEPRLVDVLVRGKMFSSVLFDSPGYDEDVKLDVAKEIAAGFVRRGYKGSLYGVRRQNDYESSQAEDMMINHPSSRITLEWNEGNGGSRANFAAIEKSLRELEVEKLGDVQKVSVRTG